MIYTVTFNPAIDYVVQLENSLQLGRINRNQTESIVFGGKGINVSCVLRELGQETVALGFVGGFTGDALERGLRECGLSTEFVHVAEGLTRINVKVKAGVETEINGIGPNITHSDLDKLFCQLDRLTCDDYLVLSGSVPACLNSDTYARVLARLQKRGVRTVVDAAGELLLRTLAYKPFLIKPNHHELGDIFGLVADSDDKIVECARRLQEKGARNVLVSMAENGALLLDEQGNVHKIGCPEGTLVSSVGAGDSMVAGFLAGFLTTADYDYALRLGTAAGSATAFSVGLADKDKINMLFSQLSN